MVENQEAHQGAGKCAMADCRRLASGILSEPPEAPLAAVLVRVVVGRPASASGAVHGLWGGVSLPRVRCVPLPLGRREPPGLWRRPSQLGDVSCAVDVAILPRVVLRAGLTPAVSELVTGVSCCSASRPGQVFSFLSAALWSASSGPQVLSAVQQDRG